MKPHVLVTGVAVMMGIMAAGQAGANAAQAPSKCFGLMEQLRFDPEGLGSIGSISPQENVHCRIYATHGTGFKEVYNSRHKNTLVTKQACEGIEQQCNDNP